MVDHLQYLPADTIRLRAAQRNGPPAHPADGPIRSRLDAHLHLRRGHAAQRVSDLGRGAKAGFKPGGLHQSAEERSQPGQPELPMVELGDVSEVDKTSQRVRAKISSVREIEYQVVTADDRKPRLM